MLKGYIFKFVIIAAVADFIRANNCSGGLCKFEKLADSISFEVDCSDLNLGCIPSFNNSVVRINLTNNNLSLFDGTFSPYLLNLDISHNPFREVNVSVFSTLKSLKHLGLRNTSLEHCKLSLNEFEKLHNLESIDIQHNYDNGNFPYAMLTTLFNLTSLYINGYQDGFGQEMIKLRNLKVLFLSGITGKCNIPVLHERYFKHIEGIENLTITQCGIQQIHRHSVSKFVGLKYFDFSHNKNLSFAVLSNVTFDLKGTDIENLLFNEIHCTHGLGTEIYEEDLQYLKNTKLKKIFINSNRLELIDYVLLSQLPKLEYISLSDNRLSAGKYIFRTFFLQSLRAIDISYQVRTDIPDEDDYMHCKDTSNRRQMHVKFNGGLLKYRKPDQNCDVLIPKELETIYYRYSKLKIEIRPIYICNVNSLRYIYLQGNTLYKWTGPIKNLPKLEILDLSYNFCSDVSDVFFTFLDNLIVLNVSNNFLGYSIQKDHKGKIFKTLQKLKMLNLASNKIHLLPSLIFRNLCSLEVLNLSHNSLINLDFEFNHMRKLKELDISNNRLSTLSRKCQIRLAAMSDQLTVNITNNPLQCNCDDILFWKWLAASTFVVYSSTKVCVKGKFHDIFNNHNLTLSIILMEKQCASYVELISVISSCIFVTVLLTLCAIVNRYKWKLRYLYYTLRNKYRGYTSILERSEYDNFMYDCFISYADEDRQFAFHEMIKNIENNTDIKLCFHQRDFTPGLVIEENITNAIHMSRKTICVLSLNYLNSHWCMFEFNMARMESIYSRNGENCLMFIFFSPVRWEDMPLSMMYIIQSKSYIEYPDDNQGRTAFWLKLKEAIGTI